MKAFCCYTPSHEYLYKEYFLPSFPSEIPLQSILMEINGSGDFLSPDFLKCVQEKITLVIDSLIANPGELILWTDIDIIYFHLSPDNLKASLGEADLAFQREFTYGKDVNTGFFVCRSSPETIRFFETVRAQFEHHRGLNEQGVINILLKEPSCTLNWKQLPLEYYARSHGWPPPRNLALYHANDTAGKRGIKQKIDQFSDIQLYLKHPHLGGLYTRAKCQVRALKRQIKVRIKALLGRK